MIRRVFIITLFLLINLGLFNGMAHAANRLLYENFDDQKIDSKLTTRIYGVWGLTEGVEYDLKQIGRGGSGFSFTSTTNQPANEAFLEWTNYKNPGNVPTPWPTNELYVSFWLRFPNFKSTASHENIKLFYPHWGSTSNYVAYSLHSPNSIYHSEKSKGQMLTSGNWITCPGQTDGKWHRYEFYIDFYKGISRFWYDGEIKWDKTWGTGTWSTPVSIYYITFGSIDASGNSVFNRQFDDIEVWDGMPGKSDTRQPEEPETPVRALLPKTGEPEPDPQPPIRLRIRAN